MEGTLIKKTRAALAGCDGLLYPGERITIYITEVCGCRSGGERPSECNQCSGKGWIFSSTTLKA